MTGIYPFHDDVPSNLRYKPRQIPTLKCFSPRIVIAQSIEASC